MDKIIEELHKKYCCECGSQRCTGEDEWLEGCPHYRELKERYGKLEKNNLS